MSANGYSSYSGIVHSTIGIGVECGSGSYTPPSIMFGTGGNAIRGCVGILDFGAIGTTFTTSNEAKNISDSVGQTGGDNTLPGGWAAYTSGFPADVAGYVSLCFLSAGNEVMVSWAFDIASGTRLKTGQTIVAMNPDFAYATDKIIAGMGPDRGLISNVNAPAYLKADAVIQYAGPTYTSSGASWWHG